jgi:hypothetical protein
MLELVRRFGHTKTNASLSGSDWSLLQTSSNGIQIAVKKGRLDLREYCREKLLRGVVTGLNDAFVITGIERNRLIQECPEAKILIKRFVVGRDLGRWTVVLEDRSLIYMHHGISIKTLGPVITHLRPYTTQLEGRATSQCWYELQQPQMRYCSEFEKPKILFQEIATYQTFAFDSSSSYINNKAFMIPLEDHYLLAVLNPAVAWRFLNDVCPKLHGGTLRMQSAYVQKLPISNPSDKDRAAIVGLVRRCLDNPTDLESEGEIERSIAELYGLSLKAVDNFATEDVKGRRVRRATQ